MKHQGKREAPLAEVRPAIPDGLDRVADLREQLRAWLRARGLSQGQLARARGVRVQTVNAVLRGKKPLLGNTLVGILEHSRARLVVAEFEPQARLVYERAFAYGLGLFPKASLEKHSALASSVAWLCTGDPRGLLRAVRALAVQDQLSPILSFEQALCGALPLVYGPLGPLHRGVVAQNPEGDDPWDAVQVRLWQAEADQPSG